MANAARARHSRPERDVVHPVTPGSTLLARRLVTLVSPRSVEGRRASGARFQLRLAGRLHVLVQGDLLVRVHGAQERAVRLQRRLDLGIGQRRAALRAASLDDWIYALVLLELHQLPLPTTC